MYLRFYLDSCGFVWGPQSIIPQNENEVSKAFGWMLQTF